MRRLVIPVLAIAALAVGSASAQGFSTAFDTTQYAGVGAGLPFGALYGLSDALAPGVDVRFRVGVVPIPGFFAILAGVDVIAEVASFGDGTGGLYVGGGPGATYALVVGESGFGVEVSAILGVHARFSEGVSGFLEGGPALAYVFGYEGIDVIPRSTLGVLFHF
jgi:hypothetical protein